MREIKFRGLTISGEMVYGLLAQSHGLPWQPIAGFYISNRGGSPWAFEVRPETIGQFTDLHDKNGKEIFEGDVVKYLGLEVSNGKQIYPERRMIVTWDYYELSRLMNIMGNSKARQAVVVGNVHQNPELIECAR